MARAAPSAPNASAERPRWTRLRAAAALACVAPPLVAQPLAASAAEATSPAAASPQQVVITGTAAQTPAPWAVRAPAGALNRARAATSDTARLLQDLPGVSLYGAGGVSGLPSIRGLADDRLRIQVDGMDLVASCPNHMNSPLSYIDPSQVASVQVFAGLSPVSVGGDNLGGTIQVESAPPSFAAEGESRSEARAGGFYRSQGDAHGGHLAVGWANDRWAVSYNGNHTRQRNLRAAAGFKPVAPGTEVGAPIPADVIGSSAYDATNHAASVAWRLDDHLLQLRLGAQDIGFEGFPNQRMDLTSNRSAQWNFSYSGRFAWGQLKARLYRQTVDHAMDMGPDRYQYGFGMPMLTESTTRGAQLQAEWVAAEGQTLRAGLERQTYVLYDWWPPVGGSMGPNDFWNIDFGQRHRSGAYAEWEAAWSPQWLTLAGFRADRVMTDAGPVQGYDNGLGAIWGNEATAFNALDRRRRDRLWDFALLARHTPDAGRSFELGLARKSRAPNLYQRYPWSTQPMAALMNNFIGDGNGYIGNPDLKPEVAHTLALSAAGNGGSTAVDAAWRWKASLWHTDVQGFIDARRCDFGQCSAANLSSRTGFVLLTYANQRARLQGLELSGQMPLMRGDAWGRTDAAVVLNWLRGRNRTTGEPLYNQMPANARLSLEHHLGDWIGTAEWQLVSAKRAVSAVRNEVPTPGYGLLNLRISRQWKHLRLDAGIDNLFDRFHRPPLGGAYVGQGPSMTTAGIAWGNTVPGPGRSLHLALNFQP